MRYVKHILLPNEQILYDGHVHPRVMLPGILILAFAAWILIEAGNTGGGHSFILSFAAWLAGVLPSTYGFYKMLYHWQVASPNIALEIKVLALAIALFGFSKMMNALVLIQTTELVVTDKRIIAKTGLMTVITVEMDRSRVAGVTVEQSFTGRIMNYGYIHIQGFTTSINDLPVMVNPHLVEKFVC